MQNPTESKVTMIDTWIMFSRDNIHTIKSDSGHSFKISATYEDAYRILRDYAMSYQ